MTVGSNNENKSLKAVQVKIRRELHITKLSMDTNCQDLKDYIEKKGVDVEKCEELKPPERINVPRSYKSFHATITSLDKTALDKVFDSDEWLIGIAVRRFWIKLNTNEQEN